MALENCIRERKEKKIVRRHAAVRDIKLRSVLICGFLQAWEEQSNY